MEVTTYFLFYILHPLIKWLFLKKWKFFAHTEDSRPSTRHAINTLQQLQISRTSTSLAEIGITQICTNNMRNKHP
jgi:hypothetical protein